MIKILLVCMLVSFAFGANLVDVLQQNGLHTLISMVQKAELSNTLLSGSYTVFAPTDAAFAALPEDIKNKLSQDKIGLANLLKYHVVQGSIPKSAVSNELQLTTLNGAQVRFNTYKFHVVTIQGMKITHSDRKTDNGYVHVISGVMLPPEGSIVDIVAASADFTTLLEKVKEANLVSALQGNNLTVFAPTNDAFRYLSSTTRNKLANDPNYLREVLLYHVVPSTKYTAGLSHIGEHLVSLDTNRDYINTHYRFRLFYANNAVLLKSDVGATNGVIHVVNHVLLPETRYGGLSIFG